MVILGIDPGTAMTGCGVISFDEKGVKLIEFSSIKTTVEWDQPRRLEHIHNSVISLMERHKPDAMAIESLFFNSNAFSALAVGQAIGVIKLAAAKSKVTVVDYPPLKIKMWLTGAGRAEKKHVQEKVRKILKLKEIPRPTHAADALAAAICHYFVVTNKEKPINKKKERTEKIKKKRRALRAAKRKTGKNEVK